MNRMTMALVTAALAAALGCSGGGGGAPGLSTDGVGQDAADAVEGLAPDQAQDPAGEGVAAEVPEETPVDPGNEVTVHCLSVVPSDVVDFGLVQAGGTSKRYVTIGDTCHDPLMVVSIKVEDDPGGLFGVHVPLPFPFTLPAFETLPVEVSFRPVKPGPVTARLVIWTDGGVTSVTLDADAGPVAACDPVLVPEVPGVQCGGGQTSFIVRNKGIGSCTFVGAGVVDCQAGDCPLEGPPSTVVEVVSAPAKGDIGPGAEASVVLLATPPSGGFLAPWHGRLWVRLIDPSVIDQPAEIVLPKGETGPNLECLPAPPPGLAVDPDHVGFGVVDVGCEPAEREVCLTATQGPSHAIDDVRLSGCSPEFQLGGLPALPGLVAAGSPLCFSVRYAPADRGEDTCALLVESGGVTFATPVEGEGAWVGEATDVYVQTEGAAVDVLFVIDDSGSMCDDHPRLAAAAKGFLEGAGTGKPDYHVGIIGVDVTDPSIAGKLNLGVASATPRFVTPGTPDPAEAFEDLMGVLQCHGAGHEAGLESMRLALSPPLAAAGGWNEGFLRQGAFLEVVVFSDEDDQSPDPVESYASFLSALKGGVASVHLNAIVGPVGGCEVGWMTAEAGLRYAAAAVATGGRVQSFCEEDLSPVFEGIEHMAFNLVVQFFLTRHPVPGTIDVSVDGEPCKDGWSFDGPSNSILFDPEGPCMPGPGDKVEVTYKLACGDAV